MDDNYDYDEFNDAADDWEMEAAEEEARENEILTQKAYMKEQKLQKAIKAPGKKKKEEEEEEVLPEDITRALVDIKEKVSSVVEFGNMIKDKSSSDPDSVRIADLPCATAEEATALGEAVAVRMLKYADSQHFNIIVGVVFQDIAKEFSCRNTLNAEASKVHVASEEAKRANKKTKKGKTGRQNDESAREDEVPEGVLRSDALSFDTVNDKGGAADVAIDDHDFM